ncbi:MAG: hypothetical protein Ct9H300mP28_28480 [Pseudomonadota bacterium]|nr:MAG: hypothetical protein Ct9H300mP28_28480 [Pseudomonadota bacterium]
MFSVIWKIFFGKLVPKNRFRLYSHVEGPDDMPSHIRSVLTKTSEQIPLSGGEMLLGTWQGKFFSGSTVHPGHSRNVVVNISGD